MTSPIDQSYRPPYLGTVAPSPAALLRAHVEQTRARATESIERQQALAEAVRLLAGAREGVGR